MALYARQILPTNRAAFVDGYWLLRRGAETLGKSPHEIGINARELSSALQLLHTQWSPFNTYLRAYFYDGQFDPSNPHYLAQRKYLDDIAGADGVQLRTGQLVRRRGAYQQKGVDSLLVLDMVTLAFQGAYQDAILVAGDADFAGVVEVVQSRGIRVARCGPPGNNAVSQKLIQLADASLEFSQETIAKICSGAPAPRYATDDGS